MLKKTIQKTYNELTVWPSSAEARCHHELWEDAGSGGSGAAVDLLKEHEAAGPAGWQQSPLVPEGEEPEWTLTQNCRQGGAVLVPHRHFNNSPWSSRFHNKLLSLVSMICHADWYAVNIILIIITDLYHYWKKKLTHAAKDNWFVKFLSPPLFPKVHHSLQFSCQLCVKVKFRRCRPSFRHQITSTFQQNTVNKQPL